MHDPLVTDLYELRMAASYLRRGLSAPATFSLTVRDLPPGRGFLVAAGLEEVLDYLEAFHFDDHDLDALADLGFDAAACAAFAGLRFTGEVQAVPEGTILVAEEPLLEVTAPLPEAQLVESVLLNRVTFPTAVAAKAARCRLAAAGRIELVEFGLRRAQGVDAAMAAARSACMVGFSATSNVAAARRLGVPAAGTMAHSYVEAFGDELEAFRAFGRDFPDGATFLVDTYDVANGTARAARAIRELHLEAGAGVRIDSGDLAELAHGARRLLDRAGLPDVRIFVTGGLDEADLARLVAGGAPVDGAGIGTRLGVSADAPSLDSAYKLVAYDGRAVAKQSAGKAGYPGAKQVFRGPGLRDRLGLRGEPPPAGTSPLLAPVMVGGRRVAPAPAPPVALADARHRFEQDLAELPAPARRVEHPEPPRAEPTVALRRLTREVRRRDAPGAG